MTTYRVKRWVTTKERLLIAKVRRHCCQCVVDFCPVPTSPTNKTLKIFNRENRVKCPTAGAYEMDCVNDIPTEACLVVRFGDISMETTLLHFGAIKSHFNNRFHVKQMHWLGLSHLTHKNHGYHNRQNKWINTKATLLVSTSVIQKGQNV